MLTLEASIGRKLKYVVLVQVVLLCLAVATQLDVALNRRGTSPNWLFLLIGFVVGLLLGLLLQIFVVRKLAKLPFRLILPFWLGMFTTALFFSGLVLVFRISIPMDWRTILATTLAGTLPGAIVGGMVSLRVSRDIVQAEPEARGSTVVSIIDQLQQVQVAYPKSNGELSVGEDNTYYARLRVPRTNEDLVFYIACDKNYPVQPPLAIGVELAMKDGSTHSIQYDAPIVHYWNKEYGFKHIIEEALQILIR